MKKYGVLNEQEHFQKGGTRYPYRYQNLTNTDNIIYFDTIEEAKKHIDEYNISYELSKYHLYVDYLSLFEVDEDGEIIGDNIYNRGYDIKSIEESENIKIEY